MKRRDYRPDLDVIKSKKIPANVVHLTAQGALLQVTPSNVEDQKLHIFTYSTYKFRHRYDFNEHGVIEDFKRHGDLFTRAVLHVEQVHPSWKTWKWLKTIAFIVNGQIFQKIDGVQLYLMDNEVGLSEFFPSSLSFMNCQVNMELTPGSSEEYEEYLVGQLKKDVNLPFCLTTLLREFDGRELTCWIEAEGFFLKDAITATQLFLFQTWTPTCSSVKRRKTPNSTILLDNWQGYCTELFVFFDDPVTTRPFDSIQLYIGNNPILWDPIKAWQPVGNRPGVFRLVFHDPSMTAMHISSHFNWNCANLFGKQKPILLLITNVNPSTPIYVTSRIQNQALQTQGGLVGFPKNGGSL